MKLYKLAFIPFAMFVTACGGDGSTIDLSGKTPEQQADTVADASCSQELECDQATVSIGTDPETEMTTCEVTFEAGTQDDYDMCYDNFHTNALDIFTNCELTEADLTKIEQCFNMQSAQGCVTAAQMDDYCDQIIAGTEEPVLMGHEVPAVCDEVDAIIEACGPQA